MGDSRRLLPQEIAQIFFGNYRCPVLPSGILAAAPLRPGWRNAEGLRLPPRLIPSRLPAAGLSPGVGAGLSAGRPGSGSGTLPCPSADGRGDPSCHRHTFADACGGWMWWWLIVGEEVWKRAGPGARWWVMVWGRGCVGKGLCWYLLSAPVPPAPSAGVAPRQHRRTSSGSRGRC